MAVSAVFAVLPRFFGHRAGHVPLPAGVVAIRAAGAEMGAPGACLSRSGCGPESGNSQPVENLVDDELVLCVDCHAIASEV